MISKEQHAAALEAVLAMQVLGEVAERLGDVGSGQDCDMVPGTWLGWLGAAVNAAAERLQRALEAKA